MSKLLRASTALVVGCLAVPLWGVGPASAADVTGSATEPAGSGAYFSSAGIAKPDPAPQAPPNVTKEADGVSPGNLAVSARGGMEDKVSFLFFPLASAPLGATVTKAVLTVPTVDNAPPNDVSTGGAPAKVAACKPSETGFGGEDGDALALAPARLCEEFAAAGKPSADGKAYVFDITALAATWTEVNDGVALTAAEGADSTPFQVVFASFDKATLAYSFTAPEEVEVTETVDTTVDPVDPGVPFDSGSTDLGGGFDTPASVDPGGFGTAEAPVVDTALPAAPTTADAPAGEAPVTAGPATTPVASVRPGEVMSPTVTAWLAGLGFALLLALLSLVMGDPKVPTTTSTPSRLTQALQDRQRASAGPTASPLRPAAG